jgi:stage V sporulation protein D (sporulation-specific penicillin-binding protein)
MSRFLHHTRNNFSSNFRLNVVLFLFLSAFALVNIRLFQIQVLAHDKYETMAKAQYWDQEALPARRGDIISSDGFVLAGTQSDFLMYAEPKKVTNAFKLANDLAGVMISLRKDTQFAGFYDKFLKSLQMNLLWVPLERNLTLPEKDRIAKLNIEGIGFEESPIRFYPEGNLASHVLGFVASDEKGEKIGYYGIEGSLNEDLKGKPGRVQEETDANGVPILVGGYKKTDPVEGRNVVLTINRAAQYIAEKRIKEGVEKYDAASGSIIVMNPSTGEILAMANYPDYSPGDFSAKEEDPKPDAHRKTVERVNYAVSHTYEPGSVMKGVTISTAIDLGLITPETTFEDNGPVRYSDYTINNWDGQHYGVQNIIQLLQKSNNIGAAWVGHKVGPKKLAEYFKDFGIGTKTNVDLEGEETGLIKDYQDLTDIDLANMSFGQGVSATPLQVLNAYNAIANGGYLLQPKIISKIVDGSKVTEIPTKSVRKAISSTTASTMDYLLEQAVEGGEAKFFALKDYRIAGKTGTAQIPENGRYADNKTNATFVGYLVGSKKLSMIIKLEEPRTSIYAAETSVPLWMETISDLVKYYGIPPDK